MTYQDRHQIVIDFLKKTGGLPFKAFNLVEDLYKDKKRINGRPFLDHFIEALRIAMISNVLSDKRSRIRIIVAILLHDTVEDGLIKIRTIKDLFSAKFASDSRRLSKHGKSIEKYIKDLLKDFVLVVAKICDRIANLLDASFFSHERWEEYLKETREEYVPMIEKAIKKFPQKRSILLCLRGELLMRLEQNEKLLKLSRLEKK